MQNRYSRQTLFSPIGEEGQTKIKQSTALLIGCGALGTAIAETLTRAGIGKLIIADRDYVEPSNLQRQQLFTEQDAIDGTPKVVAAKRQLKTIRDDVEIETILNHIDGPLLEELAGKADIILDATDNFETRLVINDIAWKLNIPWVYGACVGSSSTIYPFIPSETACFRCLLPVMPAVNETCDTTGIIAPAVQITAAHQSAEALKWLSGNKDAMRKKMLTYDVWNNTNVEAGFGRMKNENCETCGPNSTFPSLTPESGTNFAVLCGRDTVQVIPEKDRVLSLGDAERVAEKLGNPYKKTPYFIEMNSDGYRCILFANGRLLIHGLKDIQTGRKMYHQFFG
ncbi:ThiF family adenylyltransferase [Sporosarcina sp. Marseille-Q4063]|uniref:ThiF family adenylyltransferase n=1 Tax=Sporosarcina sp. Marseille-Q4063 TaxID=2810514 RepID=UPI001BAF9947|nr:ThiF family adenylyltransferase [Sporosarcina sp. Marseille-Q4063]QUW21032.1 ThiF family adenylyltransferase [Sporosarcina sp. Marseille-Q4063]